MSRSVSIILAALAIGALCVFCASKHSRLIVDKLTGSSQAALSEANYSWATVSFDGRSATITGVAPAPEDRNRAVSLINQIQGVASVSSELTIGDLIRELRASRRDSLVTLSGKVPSEATRTTILESAASVFASDSLVDMLTIQGGPEDEQWTRVVTDGIALLPTLQEGEMRLVNNDVSLHGNVEKPSMRDSLRQSLADLLPEGYTSTTEIDVPANLESLTADECEAELTNIVQDRQITFASGSARLTPEASPVLEETVGIVLRCSDASIEVGGYTDSWGDAAENQQLSQLRAQAVVDYLSSRGIESSRLVAMGYGEANPIATNRTWTGRSINRRIQFTIIR